jgi:hypothetical protein
MPTGCDPSAFADQVSTYLDRVDRRPVAGPPASVGPAARAPVTSGADRRVAVRLERLNWAIACVDGAVVDLVDLSFTGAQVIAPMLLQPGGFVDVQLAMESRAIRCEAGIVWGGFEIAGPTHDTCYRAGMHFKDADQAAVERFYSGRN